MAKGWIKLYRKSEDNKLYFSEPFDKWHAWQDILLMVNHEKRDFISKGQLVKLEAGQMITSIAILAERWKWSTNKVRRYLLLLNGMGMCNINGTLITVVNWALYQGDRQANGIGDGTADGTTDGTADGTLTRIYKNEKEYKKPQAAVGERYGVQREIDLDAMIIDQIISRGKVEDEFTEQSMP